MNKNNIHEYSCINTSYKFSISTILYSPTDKIVGYEGNIEMEDSGTQMVWDANGTSLSANRGFDIVKRIKF